MTAVLLVEDDLELGAQVQERLQRAGLAVTWWKEGRALVEGAVPAVQLVILDLMVPGVYGLDMLRALRGWSEVPVMVLSARNDSADKVRALQLGADDYMTKPFWPDELVERVRARLRRPTLTREGILALPGLRIDRAARSVHVADARVELTRVEFELLRALAERCGEALTRRALTERCLDTERDGGDRALDAHLSRLRKKLGPTVTIETVWGIGYRLPRRDGA
ncbi:MAG: response regulator transcription factor [Polyangiales bacterium]